MVLGDTVCFFAQCVLFMTGKINYHLHGPAKQPIWTLSWFINQFHQKPAVNKLLDLLLACT